MRLALGCLCLASLTAQADAVLVDRIAAVVDAHAITRSALEARARGALALAKSDAEKARARRVALTELTEETLIRQDAERLGLQIRDEEVEAALSAVATQAQLTVPLLLVEAKRQGLEADAYRATLRRQLLEYKWLSVRGNRPGPDVDLGAFMAVERVRLLNELRANAVIEVRP